eukprot:4302787-Pleurochrysis_carterae.AAC.1
MSCVLLSTTASWEKKWRIIGPLSHGPLGRAHGFRIIMPEKEMPRQLEYDHLLTRLRRSRAVDTDHRFILRDDIGNVINDHVYERDCVHFNDLNIYPRLRANEKFNKIINDIWKLAVD